MVNREIPHRSGPDAEGHEHARHACGSCLRIVEQACLVGEAKQLGKMQHRAGALLASQHGEMILMAVEIRHEHDAGLVEAGRRLEDVARQRHCRCQDLVEAGDVAGGQFGQRRTCGRRNGVEDAQQRMAVAVRLRFADAVAGNQLRICLLYTSDAADE